MQTNTQKPFGQLWPPTRHEALPPVFEFRQAFGQLAPDAAVEVAASIPLNRLYGVLVALEGAAAAAQIEVTMWGSNSGGVLSQQQYKGTANAGNNFRDEFQQWRYRDYDGERLVRIRFKNVGTVATAFTAVIQGEPF